MIKEPSIRSFRGALKRDFQGCFITLSDFSKSAIQSAQSKDHELINLINGRQFVQIFIEQYETIMNTMRQDDSDQLADKLQFRKALLVL